jgi:RNA polymerase sigma-54 factor
MKSRTRITIAQSQRLSLNARLITSIRILRADTAELTAMLEDHAATNPALQLGRPAPGAWLPRWTDALARAWGPGSGPDIEALAGPGASLHAHVAREIARLRLAPAERRFALLLAEALEPSGWLGRPPDQIAEAAGVAPDMADLVLTRLQAMEPTGLFARGLEECLRLQAGEAGELDPVMDGVLARLPLLATRELALIARQIGTTEDEVAERLRRLRRYDPKPGARFAPGAAPVPEPDLVVERGAGGRWEVRLNRSSLPTLTVAEAPPEGRAAAQMVLRLVEGRNATLLKVAQEVLRRQEAALTAGFGALVPMTMAEVAQALGLHQTTVSRVVAGSSVDTPQGTWWLRALFSSAVRDGAPAGAALRDALARMVATEDPGAPLTDARLAADLAGAGAPLARRTVAKYRDLLGIPPAHARRRR